MKQGFKRSLDFVFWMALVMQLLAQVLRNVPSVIKQKHFPVLGHVHDFLAVTQLDFSHVTVHQACLDLDLDMATIATVAFEKQESPWLPWLPWLKENRPWQPWQPSHFKYKNRRSCHGCHG